ncbi:hypothetical protein SAMN04487910_1668 [Aquimarina amphilecti]|uniref:DUF2262 domain-containing protein n=1 Tax=Aquimarina amphilecti TaxID=1038014 RepID=A0A1H7MB95_AQUAM|nr:DUF2262 domain-containing protein [Aquimarina amphilecti]SEL08546.1 hypothetical protein SAMN04487910_1668 [Aquimarina amphilecti]
MKITKEKLDKDLDIEGSYKIIVTLNTKKIDLRLDPDDATIEETIVLANKLLENFEFYEKKAKDAIVRDFLDNYNENWADEKNGHPQLEEQGFRNNLELNGINFLSKDSIDVFYNENGMFGNHSLIAQSFDGENFDDSTMYG